MCCSTKFNNGWKVSQGINNIEWIGISKFNSKRNYEIVKRICALANIGGGVLLVGVDEKNRTIKGFKINK